MKDLERYVLTIAVLITAFVPRAFSAQRWSLDFESGFNASSGTLLTAGEVSIVTDAGTGSHVAKIGDIAGDAAIDNYYGLPTTVIGDTTGRVDLDFKLTQALPTAGTGVKVKCLFMTDYRNQGDYFWYFGLWDANQVFVDSYEGIPTMDIPGEKRTFFPITPAMGAPLGLGWHHMIFTWNQTRARVYPNTRALATLTMSIDGVQIFNWQNAPWNLTGNTKISVGGFFSSGSVGYFQTGPYGIYIDNVVVSDHPAVCGDVGTVYLDADINHDCYVDMKDLLIICSEWVKCTDPTKAGCFSY